MRTNMKIGAIVLMGLMAGFGCSKSEEKKAAPPAPSTSGGDVKPAGGDTKPAGGDTKPAGGDTAAKPAGGGTGTINATITLDGDAPKMPELPRNTDPVCAATKMNAPYVVVGANKGLKDVLVRLPIGAAKGEKAPADSMNIEQKDCMYSPRVSGIMAGQTITIKNSDKTTHNIHTYNGDETVFNEAQQPGAPDLKKDVSDVDPGKTIKLKCDVHKWMEGYVVVSDSPFFKVSGDDGMAKLENVPAGTYKLEAWHPYLGLVTADVTVEAGKTAEAKFVFKAADYKAPQ